MIKSEVAAMRLPAVDRSRRQRIRKTLPNLS